MTPVLGREVKDVNFLSVKEDRKDLEVDHPLDHSVKIHVNVYNTLSFIAQQRVAIEKHQPPLSQITVYVRGDRSVEDVYTELTVGGTIFGYLNGETFFVATSAGPKTPTTTVNVTDLAKMVTTHTFFSTIEELSKFLTHREDRAGMYEPCLTKTKTGDEDLQLAAATSVDYVRQLKWLMSDPTVNHVLVVPGNINTVVCDLMSSDAHDTKHMTLKEGLIVWKGNTLVLGNIEYAMQLKNSGGNEKLCIRYQLMSC